MDSLKDKVSTSLSPEAIKFKSYENDRIIKYDNKGSISLTREASLLYSASLPKPEINSSTINQETNKEALVDSSLYNDINYVQE